jgi:23S rRNA (guanosine2251-2'-O)-methyltransferase
VDRSRLDHLAQTDHHQGVVAEADAFSYVHLKDLSTDLLLVLDTLQDPQNFGTLLRTAQATGVTGVIIPEHRAVGITPAVVNTSSGAVEHLKVARVTNLTRALEHLKSNTVWVYGLAVEGRRPYWDVDWTTPSALVVGSEGSGLSRLVRETCDDLLTIPMAPGAVQSLNAAVAGSLALYAAFRSRSA